MIILQRLIRLIRFGNDAAKNTEMAVYSVEDKRAERYREAVDEYYAFKNEFPESKYMKDADRIFKEAQKILKD